MKLGFISLMEKWARSSLGKQRHSRWETSLPGSGAARGPHTTQAQLQGPIRHSQVHRWPKQPKQIPIPDPPARPNRWRGGPTPQVGPPWKSRSPATAPRRPPSPQAIQGFRWARGPHRRRSGASNWPGSGWRWSESGSGQRRTSRAGRVRRRTRASGGGGRRRRWGFWWIGWWHRSRKRKWVCWCRLVVWRSVTVTFGFRFRWGFWLNVWLGNNPSTLFVCFFCEFDWLVSGPQTVRERVTPKKIYCTWTQNAQFK